MEGESGRRPDRDRAMGVVRRVHQHDSDTGATGTAV